MFKTYISFLFDIEKKCNLRLGFQDFIISLRSLHNQNEYNWALFLTKLYGIETLQQKIELRKYKYI